MVLAQQQVDQDQGRRAGEGNLAALIGAVVSALIAVALTLVLIDGLGDDRAVQAMDSETPLAPVTIGDNGQRFFGADRYETAVAVSREFYDDPGGVRIAALASGEDFPDALSLGPNMSRTGEGFWSGPVLLTEHGSLPAVIAEELQRLQPCWLLVVGGIAAISEAVALEADGFTDSTQDKC